MSLLRRGCLTIRFVVERPARRATGRMNPMNCDPRRAAVRHGLAFHRELPKLAKKSCAMCRAAAG